MKKVVIIGAVAGGATAAGRLARLSKDTQILMLDKGNHMSFANCGLPYYIGGVVKNKEELLLTTPEDFKRIYGIEVRLGHEVTAIDTQAQTLSVTNVATGEQMSESYDQLVLSMGAMPIPIPIEGSDHEGVFRLRTYDDAVGIRDYMDRRKPKHAVVVGGGFIGLEMVENFVQQGLDVSLIQRGPQVFSPLDVDMAAPVQTALEEQGVELILSANMTSIVKKGNKLVVHIEGRPSIETDLVMLSLGVQPDTQIAADAGIKLGIRGSIITNNRMETSAPNVYAIGDAVQVRHSVSGEPALISLAGPAHMQARIAAENIAGHISRYRGSQGSSILKLFDVTIATTGLNSTQAEEAGFQHDSITVHSVSHASYFPGAAPYALKVVYEEFTGRILGGQVVGGDGVDKRADSLATAIYAGLNAWDLEQLQLCYAPPYSSPRSAINIAGGMIVAAIEQRVVSTNCTLLPIMEEGNHKVVLDLRDAESFQEGHVEGAINLPFGQLKEAVVGLDKSKAYYLLDEGGRLSNIGTQMLTEAGFKAFNICGGWTLYKKYKKYQ